MLGKYYTIIDTLIVLKVYIWASNVFGQMDLARFNAYKLLFVLTQIRFLHRTGKI